MPGISIHVVDISRGVMAEGMRAELFRGDSILAGGKIGANGLLEHPALNQRFAVGDYRAVFHVGDYYRGAGVAQPAHPFLHVVHYDFGIADPAQHYHLPFKCTPWGYSCFRGGA